IVPSVVGVVDGVIRASSRDGHGRRCRSVVVSLRQADSEFLPNGARLLYGGIDQRGEGDGEDCPPDHMPPGSGGSAVTKTFPCPGTTRSASRARSSIDARA